MTNYNKTTLATFFRTGDVPQGSDYTNLINSQVNLVETTTQIMAGTLQTPELDTALVSALQVNVTTGFSISGTVSANNAFFNSDVKVSGNVTCGENLFLANPVILSAVGTTQAQASSAIITATITRLQGASDGQATGYQLTTNSLAANRSIFQMVLNENAVSANIWPPVGWKINNLSTNTPFPALAGTTYIIAQTQISAYAIK